MDFLSKGEPCVMGERKIFKKRKPGAQCALGRDSSGTVVSEPCVCADWDFEWWVPWPLNAIFSKMFTCFGGEKENALGEELLACMPIYPSSWARWEVCIPGRGTEGGIFTEKHVQGDFSSSGSSCLESTREVGLGTDRVQRATTLFSNLQTSFLKLLSVTWTLIIISVFPPSTDNPKGQCET